jgi:hypothetical protein
MLMSVSSLSDRLCRSRDIVPEPVITLTDVDVDKEGVCFASASADELLSWNIGYAGPFKYTGAAWWCSGAGEEPGALTGLATPGRRPEFRFQKRFDFFDGVEEEEEEEEEEADDDDDDDDDDGGGGDGLSAVDLALELLLVRFFERASNGFLSAFESHDMADDDDDDGGGGGGGGAGAGAGTGAGPGGARASWSGSNAGPTGALALAGGGDNWCTC